MVTTLFIAPDLYKFRACSLQNVTNKWGEYSKKTKTDRLFDCSGIVMCSNERGSWVHIAEKAALASALQSPLRLSRSDPRHKNNTADLTTSVFNFHWTGWIKFWLNKERLLSLYSCFFVIIVFGWSVFLAPVHHITDRSGCCYCAEYESLGIRWRDNRQPSILCRCSNHQSLKY